MKKSFLFFAIFFILLSLFSCQKNDIEPTDESEVESIEEIIQVPVGENIEEFDEEESGRNIFRELPTDYTEINAFIDGVISQRFMAVIEFIKKHLLTVWTFFLSWPTLIRVVIQISMVSASFGIISSHVIGIYRNSNEWQKHPDHYIMYSYFINSGTLQRKKSYKAAHSLLRDHRWLLISFAGLAFRLGNYVNKSTMLMFIMSFIYIPLFITGFVEMFLRIIIGTLWLIVMNLIHKFILFAARLISFLLIPLSDVIDRIIQKPQYCHHCYSTVKLPKFLCPACNNVHEELIPGRCGILFVRCGCNKKFLPCTSFTGRSRLVPKCSACENELAAANARHFSIALIGGSHAGKTAFVAAFSFIYMNLLKKPKTLNVTGKPNDYFNELFEMYNSGNTENDTDSRTYSLVHKHRKNEKDNLVFYDTMAEYIISDSYPRSPKYLGFCDGVILVIDPLSVQSVRNEIFVAGDAEKIEFHSNDDIDKLAVQFIHQYAKIRGLATGKLSEIPVAIVINKSDIDFVNREIGWEKINELFNKNPIEYGNNLNDAKDQICRAYIEKLGLVNVLNNMEATFSSISYFPVSAIGHIAQKGVMYNPIGVMNPVAWIAKERRSGIAGIFKKEKL